MQRRPDRVAAQAEKVQHPELLGVPFLIAHGPRVGQARQGAGGAGTQSLSQVEQIPLRRLFLYSLYRRFRGLRDRRRDRGCLLDELGRRDRCRRRSFRLGLYPRLRCGRIPGLYGGSGRRLGRVVGAAGGRQEQDGAPGGERRDLGEIAHGTAGQLKRFIVEVMPSVRTATAAWAARSTASSTASSSSPRISPRTCSTWSTPSGGAPTPIRIRREGLGADGLDDGPGPVVAAGAAAGPQPYLARRQGDVVVDDQQPVRRQGVAGQQVGGGLAAAVHVGAGLGQRHGPALNRPLADQGRPVAARQGDGVLGGDPVYAPEA